MHRSPSGNGWGVWGPRTRPLVLRPRCNDDPGAVCGSAPAPPRALPLWGLLGCVGGELDQQAHSVWPLLQGLVGYSRVRGCPQLKERGHSPGGRQRVAAERESRAGAAGNPGGPPPRATEQRDPAARCSDRCCWGGAGTPPGPPREGVAVFPIGQRMPEVAARDATDPLDQGLRLVLARAGIGQEHRGGGTSAMIGYSSSQRGHRTRGPGAGGAGD